MKKKHQRYKLETAANTKIVYTNCLLGKFEAGRAPLQSQIWMTDIMEFMKCKMKQIQLQIKTWIQIRIDSCYLLGMR